MRAVETLEQQFYQSLELSNQRKHDRFKIGDQRHWHMKFDGRHCPIFWLNDLSSSGLQIRQGIRREIENGDVIEIQLRFDSKDFIHRKARVKWIKTDPDHVNMNLIGLEFIIDKGKTLTSIQPTFSKKNFKAADTEFVKSQITQVKELKKNRFQLSELHWILCFCLPFLAGYFFGCFS